MKRVTITLTDELETAVTTFQDDRAVPPTLTATVQVALEEYLTQRGYLVRPRSHRTLRLTPASADADTATDVSAMHDRYLAQQ